MRQKTERQQGACQRRRKKGPRGGSKRGHLNGVGGQRAVRPFCTAASGSSACFYPLDAVSAFDAGAARRFLFASVSR